MENKRSKGVTVFGWTGIISGGLGTALLVLSVIGVMTAQNFGGVMFLISAVVLLPMPLVLLTGIGLIRLRSWGRNLGLFVLPVFVLLIIILLSLYIFSIRNSDMEDQAFLASLALWGILFIGIFLILPQVYILTRPNVKEQFKK